MSTLSIFEQLRQQCPDWTAYVNHEFVRQLGYGRLPRSSFQHYLVQDYAFLLQFTRAWALALYKSQTLEEMRSAQAGINAMLDLEIGLHTDYCRNWGVDETALADIQESAACVAYTRYVLDCGMSGGLPELYAALLPCIYGYAEIGQQLAEKQSNERHNPYQSWIDMYSSEAYQASADTAKQKFDQLCQDIGSQRLVHLQQIFDTATRMEVAFWQMGLDKS